MLGSNIPMLRPVLRALGHKYKYCINCGLAGKESNREGYIHCQSYGCHGEYVTLNEPMGGQLKALSTFGSCLFPCPEFLEKQ